METRQKHGFIYEDFITLKNSLIKESNYTSKWDTYEMYNGVKTPVSIKCMGINNNIEFGSFKRQTEINDNFILYIGFWKGAKTNIVEEYKILICKNIWNKYFGDYKIIKEMMSELKSISNDHTDDRRWKDYIKKYKELYGKSIISLRFKRDHVTQKRIQCAITKLDFVNSLLKDNICI